MVPWELASGELSVIIGICSPEGQGSLPFCSWLSCGLGAVPQGSAGWAGEGPGGGSLSSVFVWQQVEGRSQSPH